MRRWRMWWVWVTLVACGVLAACGGSESLQADAGEDFNIQVGEQPVFDGCESTGEIVNYKWTIVSAPESVPEDEGKVIRAVSSDCSFTLEAEMGLEEVGVWEVELEVENEQGDTRTDRVEVEVRQ